MATRFDYRNLAGHCKEENCSEGGKSYEGGIATDTNFGKGQRSNFSNFQQTTKQWEIGELELVNFVGFSEPRPVEAHNAKAGFSARHSLRPGAGLGNLVLRTSESLTNGQNSLL